MSINSKDPTTAQAAKEYRGKILAMCDLPADSTVLDRPVSALQVIAALNAHRGGATSEGVLHAIRMASPDISHAVMFGSLP